MRGFLEVKGRRVHFAGYTPEECAENADTRSPNARARIREYVTTNSVALQRQASIDSALYVLKLPPTRSLMSPVNGVIKRAIEHLEYKIRQCDMAIQLLNHTFDAPRDWDERMQQAFIARLSVWVTRHAYAIADKPDGTIKDNVERTKAKAEIETYRKLISDQKATAESILRPLSGLLADH